MTAPGVSSVGSPASLPVIFAETKKGILGKEGKFRVCGDASAISYESGWWAALKHLCWQNVKLSVSTRKGPRTIYIKNSDAQPICPSGKGRLKDLFARALREKAATALSSKVTSVSQPRLGGLGSASEEPKSSSSESVPEVAEGPTEEVRLLFRVFADAGHKDAQYALAFMYEEKGGEEDLKEAFSLYGKASDQGHLDATYALAKLFEEGRGVQKDLSEANKLYAGLLGQGRGVQTDIERVSEEMRKQAPEAPSAEPEKGTSAGSQISQEGGLSLSEAPQIVQGSSPGISASGATRAESEPQAPSPISQEPQVEQKISSVIPAPVETREGSVSQAVSPLTSQESQSEQGVPLEIPAPVETRAESELQAPSPISQQPQVERKMPPVIPAPVEVKKSIPSPSSSPLSEESLASTGIQEPIAARPQSIPSARGSQDAFQKDLDRKYAQAFRLEQGIGGEKNLQKAFDIYQEAAREGHIKSQYALISMYLENRGLMQGEQWGIQDTKARDALYKEAIELFTKKSSQDVSALYYLGFMKENGLGMERNMKRATTLYEMAAKDGNIEAKRALGSLYERDGNIKKAKEYYKAAMDQGDIHAAFALIPIYKDPAEEEERRLFYEEAYSLFTRQASVDNDAAYYLGVMSEEGLRESKNFKNAALLYQLAAKKGNAKAQYALGSLYERGEGVEKNLYEAEKWYREAAGQKDVDAAAALLVLYERGDGAIKDERELQRLYENLLALFAIRTGYDDTKAQYCLGFMYEKGLGGKKDLSEAKIQYLSAAQGGNAQAQYTLGSLYERGEGFEKNIEEAEKWYLKAACGGEIKATYALVSLYARGWLTKENQRSDEYVKALLPISKAIRQRSANAETKYYFGLMNEKGLGVQKDINEAFRYYEEASRGGDVGAKRALGSLYERGEGGIRKNIEQAEKLYLEAACGGEINAAYDLVSLYAHEELTKEDQTSEEYRQALLPILKEIESGHASPETKYYFGVMNEKGLGVQKDIDKALQFYQEVSKPSPWLKKHLGSLYERGEGVEQNIEEAEKLYLEAIDAQDIDAAYALLSLYERGLLKKDESKDANYTYVYSLITGPAVKNDAKAQYYIGFMNEKGLGFKTNIKQAQYWYGLAAEGGNESAKTALKRLSSQ